MQKHKQTHINFYGSALMIPLTVIHTPQSTFDIFKHLEMQTEHVQLSGSNPHSYPLIHSRSPVMHSVKGLVHT